MVHKTPPESTAWLFPENERGWQRVLCAGESRQVGCLRLFTHLRFCSTIVAGRE